MQVASGGSLQKFYVLSLLISGLLFRLGEGVLIGGARSTRLHGCLAGFRGTQICL